MRTLLIIGALCALCVTAHAQDRPAEQAYLLGSATTEQPALAVPQKKRFRPVRGLFNGALTFYQKVVSPQISAGCIYETSCSRFSREAINTYGPIKGLFLTADRLSRCNRIQQAETNALRFNERGQVIDNADFYHRH